MGEPVDRQLIGHSGEMAVRVWRVPAPTWLAVLVHGYGEHVGRYQRFAESLAAAGAVVGGADLTGHGRSAGPRAVLDDLDAVVDDQHAVLTDLVAAHPGLPVVLFGHGVGGTIAIRHAQRHAAKNVAALVLSAPVLGNWPTLDRLVDDGELPAVPDDVALLSRDPVACADFAGDPLVRHGPMPAATLRAIDDMLGTIAFDHPLGDELPALWLHGSDDRLVPAEETRAGMDQIRGLKFEERIYPGARHDLCHETNSAEVFADVIDFVRRSVI
jgi:alpha-beta hydrolase superfamily lysophospholipase